jgi:hypothetical protein
MQSVLVGVGDRPDRDGSYPVTVQARSRLRGARRIIADRRSDVLDFAISGGGVLFRREWSFIE